MDSPGLPKTHYVRCLKCNKILECSRYDTNALLEHIRTDHPEIEIVDNGSNNDMPRNGHTTIREAASNIVMPHDIIDDKTSPYQPTMFEPSRDNSQSEEFKKFQPRSTSSRERMHIRSQRGIFHMPVESPPKFEMSNCDMRADRSNDTSGAYTRHHQVHTPSSQTHNERPNRSLYRTSIEKWRPATGTLYCPKCGANRRPLIRTQTERSSNNSCCAVCILGCWPFCFLPFLLPSDNKEYLHCSNCKTFLGLYDRSNNCVRPNREYCQAEETVIKETDMRAEGGESKEQRKCGCA